MPRKRQQFHVTAPDGSKVWITGNTIDEAFQNYQARFGGGAAGTSTSDSPTAPMFGAYTDEWWELYKVPKLRPTTMKTYRNLLDKHILPYFAGKALDTIDTNSVQRFFNGRNGLSKSTARQMRIILHQIFRAAMEDGYTQRDPTASTRLTLPTRTAMREPLATADYADVMRNLQQLQPNDYLLVALLAYTGVRRSEALGLQWGDVDLDKRIIRIFRSVTFVSNQPIVGEPKSKAGYRKLPIIPALEVVLRANVAEPSVYVVGGGDTPITQSRYDRAWKRISKTVNLYGATAHILRHTFMTLLASTNADVKTLQAIGGHADMRTTMNCYVHTRDEGIIAAGVAFGELAQGLVR